jgi:1,4-dihydroxy-2-naphthoate octaprenyltransferase
MSERSLRYESVRQRFPVARALWRMVRPDQFALIVLVYWLGVLLGVTVAGIPVEQVGQYRGPILGGFLALLPATATVHYANEYADYETDAVSEGTKFSGGSDALHDLGLPRSLAWQATAVSGLLVVPAVWLAVESGLPIRALALLAVIVVFGWQYSLPPLALAWNGLGIVTNAVLGAVVLPVYGYAVVAPPGIAAVLAVAPFALVTTLSLMTTQWPDREADAVAGKRTVSTRVSPERLRQWFLLGAVAYPVLVAAVHVAVTLPLAVLAAHAVPIPLLAWATRTYTRQRSPFPAVAAMVALAVASTVAWAWVWLG